MGLIVLLLVNGGLMLRSERRVAHGEIGAWLALHQTATTNLALWLLTTLAGAVLPNIG